ncbi:MAG: hypothetical protein ABUL64_02450 [Singulisphaera sp.]
MEQPVRARPTVSLAISEGTSAVSTAVPREQYVLLRVPDCSVQLKSKDAAASADALPQPGFLAALMQGLVGRWRRPRSLLTGALALGLFAVAVAVVAGNRTRGQADDARHDESAPYLHSGTRDSAGPLAHNAASMLEDAPAFEATDVNQVRANQAAQLHGSQPVGAGSAAPGVAPKKSVAPTARLEQRIDRVPSQY